MSLICENGQENVSGPKSAREKLKALFRLALNARYGDEDSRRIMRERHGVKDPRDYSGFMHGINEAIAVIDSFDKQ